MSTTALALRDGGLPVKVRIRELTRANLREDWAQLRAGVLDVASFFNGYRARSNPVQIVVRDPEGNVRHIRRTKNLRTNVGGDFQAAQMGGTAAVTSASYIALSSDATPPNTNDTALAAEIAGSGLARVQATYAHTNVSGAGVATNPFTYTLTKTFIATAVVNTLQKAGNFTAAAAGTMLFENTFPVIPALNIGDSITVTWTVTG